jgi:gliding motility-associated-like protein
VRTLISYFLFAGFFITPLRSHATHYRAGEIRYRQIAGKTYEITAVTYTDPTKPVDNPTIDINFGDGGPPVTITRTNGTITNGVGSGVVLSTDPKNSIRMNEYTTQHTYSGSDVYTIWFEDRNRIDHIININGGNTVNIPFYVQAYVDLHYDWVTNQSPVMTLPPLDVGCVGKVFKHNPAAHDPDGDSLVYVLIPPRQAPGADVPGYKTPAYSTSFSLDPHSGELVWNAPVFPGFYNIAIEIQEYRIFNDGHKYAAKLLGKVERDMQVFIDDYCQNNPPQLMVPAQTCIEPGHQLASSIAATDPDTGQFVVLTGYGGPFAQPYSRATLTPDPAIGLKNASAVFAWTPSCYAIHNRPHTAVFRATDSTPYIGFTPLTDIDYWNIRVVGPAPQHPSVVQKGSGLMVAWDPDSCGLAYGYRIYRRIDSSHWNPAFCETGVAVISGFSQYDTTYGGSNSRYLDNNAGKGMSPLLRYCYRVTSMFNPRSDNGAVISADAPESYASREVCAVVMNNRPVITNVSVTGTDATNGHIFLRWLKPVDIDSAAFPPPYKLVVKRAITGSNHYASIGKPFVYVSLTAITDTSFTDSVLNTVANGYTYKIELYCTRNGADEYMNESVAATSVFVTPYNTDHTVILNWRLDVPWINQVFYIFRRLHGSGAFLVIDSTTATTYADRQVTNGVMYDYYIQSKGSYDMHLYPYALLNASQVITCTPIDTVRPCPPPLDVVTPCESRKADGYPVLSWVDVPQCNADVTSFRLYHRKNNTAVWLLLDSVPKGIFSYSDTSASLQQSLAGCYAVAAVDSSGNESFLVNEVCIDNCPVYHIPNVFTPNADGPNDLLKPFPYRYIDRVELAIFNRWGQEVFHTYDADINWNGKDRQTGNECAAGVYFYVCDVYETYLDGIRKRALHGTVQLIR